MFSTAQKDVSAKGCSLQTDACECAEEAGRKVREFVSHTSHNMRDAQADMAQQIRSNPIKSSMIAVGIGFILGALVRR